MSYGSGKLKSGIKGVSRFEDILYFSDSINEGVSV